MKLTPKLSKIFTKKKKPKKEPAVEQQISRRNFLSFGSFLVLGSAAYGGWRWLYTSSPEIKGVTAQAQGPLRNVLNTNEEILRQLYSNKNLVKTYPKEMAAKAVRHNSDVGSAGLVDVNTWYLQVKKSSGEVLKIGIDELRQLPKTEIIYDFKCVEGWDQISHWGGVKFSDFIAHFKLDAETRLGYVGMETPDKKYYVGVDMPSAMHPQTLLAYEVNEMPLPPKHGAPLRLIIPVKYGIKNLKRIGNISFSNNRPRDYWAERGYDYYAGL